MRSATVIHTGGVGDFLQTLPVLESLRSHFPGIYVTVVGRPERAALAVAGGLADSVVDFDGSLCHRLFADEASRGDVPPALADAEMVIDFLAHPTFDANLARLTRARVVAARSFPQPGETDLPAAHWVYDRIAAQMDWPTRDATPRLRVGKQAAQWAAIKLELASLNRVTAIHPGSGNCEKNWPRDRFARLAEMLTGCGREVVWILGPAETEREAAWAGAIGEAGSRGIHVMVGASLVEVAGLLSGVECYVGNDSGITHLAAAVAAPTIALFGPTDARVWAPRGENVRVIEGAEGHIEAIDEAHVRAALSEWLR